MTTTAAANGRYRFSHVARMEWIKLRSLRSTWWVLAVTVAGAVGIAVAVEGGLIVPVVRDADQKSVSQISREAKALIERARAGKLRPEEFTGGTFTISNLGMFGIDQFTAVINPPEAAILAVGASSAVPVVRDGQLATYQRMKLTMSIDHRAVDGATGAQFLADLKAVLEEPLRILA